MSCLLHANPREGGGPEQRKRCRTALDSGFRQNDSVMQGSSLTHGAYFQDVTLAGIEIGETCGLRLVADE